MAVVLSLHQLNVYILLINNILNILYAVFSSLDNYYHIDRLIHKILYSINLNLKQNT